MRNSDYWRQRFEAIEEQAHEKAAEYIGNADTQYRRAMHSLQRDINNWYARFAQNNQISMTEARKLLSSKELEELKWTVEDYIRHGEQLHLHPEWMKQLENASARYHISRQEALRLQVRQQAELLHGNQAEEMERLLQNILSDGYDHTAFEIQKGIGVGWNVHSIDKRRIDQLLKQPWTTDERTFRDRCWTNKAELVNTVNNVMTQGIIRGDVPEKMISAITDRFDVARNKAARLVYTESAYFSAKAQESCYDDLGVESVQVLETLDSRTCAACGAVDGTVVSRKDYEPGVTVPPFHPGCRGTTCPYFDDMDDGKRIARDAEGNTYHVPANTTYEQWKEMQEGGANTVANGGNFGIIKQDLTLNQIDYRSEIPDAFIGDFSDYEELDLTNDEATALKEINALSKKDNFEYGTVFTNGKQSQLFTSKNSSRVEIPKEYLKSSGLKLLHSHTNCTPLSKQDLSWLTNPNIDEVSVITVNGDVFSASVGSGEKINFEDFKAETEYISAAVDSEMMNNPDFFDWTIEQRNYMAIKEQMFQIGRRFGWTIKGGRL